MSKFLKEFGSCMGPLDFPMEDEDARQLEKKLEEGEWSPFRFAKSGALETFSVNDTRQDVSIISDATVDKEGDIIDPDSIDFANFRKNPVVAYNHNYNLPPVGKSLWQKKVAGVWKAKTQYYDRPEDHPSNEEWFPNSIWHMIKSGGMRGKSIGGAVKWREPTKEDAEKLRFDVTKAKRISDRVELWEYSVCPIAINNNTVVEAISKGILAVNDVKSLHQLGDIELPKELLTEPEKIVIKSFQTKEEFLLKRENFLSSEVQKIKENIPQMIEDSFKRAMGKVL